MIEENAYAGRAIEVKFNRAVFKPGKYGKFEAAYADYPLEVWAWGEGKMLR
ncbi:MAG: hypothetical protein SFV52_15370 [Saprospiraceae bacterium]|nr:hypothetical protein [Saprospiraceae bacterium]